MCDSVTLCLFPPSVKTHLTSLQMAIFVLRTCADPSVSHKPGEECRKDGGVRTIINSLVVT